MNKKQFINGIIAMTAFGAITLTSVQANALDVPAGTDPATNGPDLASKGTIHIHKHETQNAGTVKGTGDVANPEPTGKPIAGVTYKVQQVKTVDGKDVTKAGLADSKNWIPLEGLQPGDPKIALDTDASHTKSKATDATGNVDFADLEAGVYLVTEDDSTLPHGVQPVGAEAANPFLVVLPSRINNQWKNEIHVYPKSAVTGIEKSAEPQKPGKAGKGSEVNWDIVSHLSAPNPKRNAQGDVDGAYTYTKVQFDDTLDSRLDYAAVKDVKFVAPGKPEVALAAGTDYLTDGSAGQTFKMVLTPTGLAKITEKGDLKFVLQTTLNTDDTSKVKNADGTPKPIDNEISNTTNAGGPEGKDAKTTSTDSNDPNDPQNDPNNPGHKKKPVVYFGNAILTKKDKTNDKVLAGAKFKVYVTEADAQKDTNAVALGDDKDFRISDSEGIVKFEGLVTNAAAPQHYWIREVEAPAGYLLNGGENNKLDIQEITVTPYETNAESATKVFTDNPVPAFALPLTGGAGTAALMTAGGAVVAAGLIVTVSRRRKKA